MNVAPHSLSIRRADSPDDSGPMLLGRPTEGDRGFDYDCPRCGVAHRRAYAVLDPHDAYCRPCKVAVGILAPCPGCGVLVDADEACCRACLCTVCGEPEVQCEGHACEDQYVRAQDDVEHELAHRGVS